MDTAGELELKGAEFSRGPLVEVELEQLHEKQEHLIALLDPHCEPEWLRNFHKKKAAAAVVRMKADKTTAELAKIQLPKTVNLSKLNTTGRSNKETIIQKSDAWRIRLLLSIKS